MKKYIKDLKILFIEDDLIASQGLIRIFSMIGIENVDYANNCSIGLDKFKHSEYDLIISDIETPIMNGIELATKIRNKDKDIPIIFTTGYSCDYYKNSAKNLNASYFSKPFKVERLIERIGFLA